MLIICSIPGSIIVAYITHQRVSYLLSRYPYCANGNGQDSVSVGKLDANLEPGKITIVIPADPLLFRPYHVPPVARICFSLNRRIFIISTKKHCSTHSTLRAMGPS
jgi:hypothetical protein